VKPRLRVWAPRARALDLVTGSDACAMQRDAHGYFEAEAPAAGSDYFVRVDGRDRPDPRSPWQPHGPHAASRWLDSDRPHADDAFRAAPLGDALFYELHVGTFTPEGTYAAAAERLDSLIALGVTHVELMPLATFGGHHGWGYDGVDLFAPHPAYGTPDELRRFVARCHARGVAVVLDVVYNHLGPSGNYLGEFGPYFTARHRTPWGEAVNLDGEGSAHVRAFLIDNARMWLERYGFDGLRLDAVHALHDGSPRHFLAELGAAVRALSDRLGRPLTLIAEDERNDPRLLRARDAGGYGLDGRWNDDFHHAVHALLTGERRGYYADFGALEHVARVLRDGYVRAHGGAAHGGASGRQLVACLQNHDQIGNRARGERIGHLVDPARVRIGAALLFVSPFVPLLFQGEEWGASSPFLYFADHREPALAEAIRRGRHDEFEAFGWKPDDVPDPLAPSTFRASVLDWAERERAPHRELLAWYTALAQLRREAPELRDGRRDRIDVWFDEARAAISVRRGGVTLQANLGAAPIELPRPAGEPYLCHPAQPAPADGAVVLGPLSCAIWRHA
jgi:maltooligosyltrehalose trehalohydrolase